MSDGAFTSDVQAGALAMIASGNTLHSVSEVFGIPVATLRGWVAQRADAASEDTTGAAEPVRPWLRFPSTVVYPTGSNWAFIATALIAAPFVVSAVAWPLVFTRPLRPVVIASSLLMAVACIAAGIQAIRAARVNCFEMRLDAIARYTLAGCTVLPYADIIGLTASMQKGFYYVEFMTRTGVLMTIHPTFSQLEDERLWTWLQAIPKRDGSSIRRLSDD